MTGIYFIKNKINNKLYVGSCKDFRKRKNNHTSSLSRGIHHSSKLQRSYDKYGLDAFEFIFVEELKEEECLTREQYWIDLLNPELNNSKLVGGHNRRSTPEEVKKRIADACKSKVPIYQFSINDEFIRKHESLSEAARSVGTLNARRHITACCRNERPYSYGYRWSYTETILPTEKKPIKTTLKLSHKIL